MCGRDLPGIPLATRYEIKIVPGSTSYFLANFCTASSFMSGEPVLPNGE